MTRSNVLLGRAENGRVGRGSTPRIVPAVPAQVLAYRLRSPGAAICMPSDRGAAMLPASALVRRPSRDRRARQSGWLGLRESR